MRQLSEDEARRRLGPGDDHYTSFVGPPAQYDLMGATQFMLLVTLGLRDHHRVLDFGCGSLRLGRLLIPYLQRGNYHGLDPNAWLIEDAIERQLGHDQVALKWPHLHHHDDFSAHRCGTDFDFIVAQSVFSHASPGIIRTALRSFGTALAPRGVALATFIYPGQDDTPDEYSGPDWNWVYPGGTAYSPTTISEMIAAAELYGRLLPWLHPRQTWYALAKDASALPPAEWDRYLGGQLPGIPEWPLR
jgi:SAM-dependent methyltransferase